MLFFVFTVRLVDQRSENVCSGKVDLHLSFM